MNHAAESHAIGQPESFNRAAVRATSHCLTGCATGEVLGMVIATSLAWANTASIASSVVLAFVFGYGLTLGPILQAGVPFRPAAGALRANSSLTPAEYRGPVLGLILLAFTEHRFDELKPELELKATERRSVSADDFRAHGVLFVPEIARLSWLVDLPEGPALRRRRQLAARLCRAAPARRRRE